MADKYEDIDPTKFRPFSPDQKWPTSGKSVNDIIDELLEEAKNKEKQGYEKLHKQAADWEEGVEDFWQTKQKVRKVFHNVPRYGEKPQWRMMFDWESKNPEGDGVYIRKKRRTSSTSSDETDNLYKRKKKQPAAGHKHDYIKMADKLHWRRPDQAVRIRRLREGIERGGVIERQSIIGSEHLPLYFPWDESQYKDIEIEGYRPFSYVRQFFSHWGFAVVIAYWLYKRPTKSEDDGDRLVKYYGIIPKFGKLPEGFRNYYFKILKDREWGVMNPRFIPMKEDFWATARPSWLETSQREFFVFVPERFLERISENYDPNDDDLLWDRFRFDHEIFHGNSDHPQLRKWFTGVIAAATFLIGRKIYFPSKLIKFQTRMLYWFGRVTLPFASVGAVAMVHRIQERMADMYSFIYLEPEERLRIISRLHTLEQSRKESLSKMSFTSRIATKWRELYHINPGNRAKHFEKMLNRNPALLPPTPENIRKFEEKFPFIKYIEQK